MASHDPDGVWHDWLEDAVAFSVTDGRYTAGVANLRATARVTPADNPAAIDLEPASGRLARRTARKLMRYFSAA